MAPQHVKLRPEEPSIEKSKLDGIRFEGLP